MSVAAEWSKRVHKCEYLVTIEGIGWPVSWADLSLGFAGTIWATNDINGDLATQLADAYTPTIKRGLRLPEAIDFSVDPRTAEAKVGGVDFTINDLDDWWAENHTPRKSGTETTLNSQLVYFDREVWLTDGTNFDEGDTIWVAGREAILLGAKVLVGGVIHKYTSSVRGWLGTPRGSNLRQPGTYAMYRWPSGASVSTNPVFWWNRKVALWAHIPGEAASSCQLLWLGELRSIDDPTVGRHYTFSAVADHLGAANRLWRPHYWSLSGDAPAKQTGSDIGIAVHDTGVELWHASLGMRRRLIFEGPADSGEDMGQDYVGPYALAAAYRYRTEPGGTGGMVTAWNAAVAGIGLSPQALDTDDDTNVVGSFVDVEGDILFMFKQDLYGEGPKDVLAEILSSMGTSKVKAKPFDARTGSWKADQFDQSLAIQAGSRARFLLANWHNNRTYNRFTVNGLVTRNPVDVLLCFMTSCDRELWAGDTNAGSTTTRINLTLTGYANDELVGRALHCVEGANKWEARTITGNSATWVDVETAFSNAPAAAKEHQIRNSIYDVLPFGWGLGVDTNFIDVESFEQLRDTYWPFGGLAPFLLGTEDEIDLWDLLYQNICRPYGIMVYLNRETRKLSARYLPHTPAIDDIEEYTSVDNSHIVAAGKVSHHYSNPVGSVVLQVRALEEKITEAVRNDVTNVQWLQTSKVPATMSGAKDTIIIKNTEVECAFGENNLDRFELEAMFDTRNSIGGLLARLRGVIGQYSVPPPVLRLRLTLDRWLTMYPGTLVELDWDDVPVNMFTGVRGWANLVGRVLSAPLPVGQRGLGFEAVIELLGVKLRGMVAPAATVTAKGNDGVFDYFVVNDTDFVADDTDQDWWHFVVGMEVELRDVTGAVKETETINSFGGNHASDPEDASNSRINVDGVIGSAIAAGDYLTLRTWYAGNPSVNEDYSAYADANGDLTGGDEARRYV